MLGPELAIDMAPGGNDEKDIRIHVGQLQISSGARKIDMDARAWQENWQSERFACSQQKDMNDKAPTI